MKKKLMALLLCSVTAVMLAACGSSNEGSTSEEKVYLEDSQIQQLFTDPEQFKGICQAERCTPRKSRNRQRWFHGSANLL